MKIKFAVAALVCCLAITGIALAGEHHHHVQMANPQGSGIAGTTNTGHQIHTHATNGRVHTVTLKHPSGGGHIRHQQLVAKGRRGRSAEAGDRTGLAGGNMDAESGDIHGVPTQIPFAFIGWVFSVVDPYGAQHIVVIWLPLNQVDPNVASQAQDID